MNLFSFNNININSSFQRSTRIDNKISKEYQKEREQYIKLFHKRVGYFPGMYKRIRKFCESNEIQRQEKQKRKKIMKKKK